MSSVRMCDVPVKGGRCGRIFSELEDGWSTGNVTVMVRSRSTGKLEPVTQAQDRCRQHSEGIVEAISPERGPDLQQRIQALESADLEWRISQAEAQRAARSEPNPS